MDPKECRICQSSESEQSAEERQTNPLMSPCECRGSVQYVHKQCLIQWMITSGRETCGICCGQYTAFPFVRKGLSFGHFLANEPKCRLIIAFHLIVTLAYLIVSVKLWSLWPQLVRQMPYNRRLRTYHTILVVLYPIESVLIVISWILWYFVFKVWQKDNFRVVFIDNPLNQQ